MLQGYQTMMPMLSKHPPPKFPCDNQQGTCIIIGVRIQFVQVDVTLIRNSYKRSRLVTPANIEVSNKANQDYEVEKALSKSLDCRN